MKKRLIIFACAGLLFAGCRKSEPPADVPPVPVPEKKILLKSVTIPGLPSPFYHFTYRPDSMLSGVTFATGFNIYEVLHQGGRISEMRNNIVISHDTLRYVYDNTGSLVRVKIINEEGNLYRDIHLTYSGGKINTITWSLLMGTGFSEHRIVTISYYSDGNAKRITDHRPAFPGQLPVTLITDYLDYDDKINVDDYTVIHDGFNEHLVVLPPGMIQKNNPRREVRSGSGIHFEITNHFTYNARNEPLLRLGTVRITSNPPGQEFQIRREYAYY
jgi:hypothetical protein